jgi:hypothetical protein
MSGKKFGDMTPEEKRIVMKKAAELLTAKLTANADEISRVMNEPITENEVAAVLPIVTVPSDCPGCHGQREWSGTPGIAVCFFCGG